MAKRRGHLRQSLLLPPPLEWPGAYCSRSVMTPCGDARQGVNGPSRYSPRGSIDSLKVRRTALDAEKLLEILDVLEMAYALWNVDALLILPSEVFVTVIDVLPRSTDHMGAVLVKSRCVFMGQSLTHPSDTWPCARLRHVERRARACCGPIQPPSERGVSDRQHPLTKADRVEWSRPREYT